MEANIRIGGPAGTGANNPVQNKPGLYQRVLARPECKPVIGFLEEKGLNKGNLIKNSGISESEIRNLAEFPAKIDLILMAQKSNGKLTINELTKRILQKELKLTKEGLVFEEKGIASKETVPAGEASYKSAKQIDYKVEDALTPKSEDGKIEKIVKEPLHGIYQLGKVAKNKPAGLDFLGSGVAQNEGRRDAEEESSFTGVSGKKEKE